MFWGAARNSELDQIELEMIDSRGTYMHDLFVVPCRLFPPLSTNWIYPSCFTKLVIMPTAR